MTREQKRTFSLAPLTKPISEPAIITSYPKPTALPKPQRRVKAAKPIARRSPVRRVSKRPAARLTRLLDEIWREQVEKRAHGRCERCQSPQGSDAHHVISRRYRATRHEIENGVYLCRWHHTEGPDSAHRKPREFKEWFMHTFRERWAELMKVKGNSR